MRRGEVWIARFSPTEGREIGKIRPSVIVSDDGIGKLPLKVIVPITTWQERYADVEWMVRLNPNDTNG
jgi:mRNA interferase MazF